MFLHIDGFDSYAVSSDLLQEYVGQSCNFSTTAGRFGQGCMQINGNSSYLTWGNSSQMSEIWAGFAIQCTNSGQNFGPFITIVSANGTEAEFQYAPISGNWAFTRGTSTYLGTYTYPISLSTYNWIEIHYKISSSVGIAEIWVNGTRVINLTGINTTSYSSTSFGTIKLGGDGSSGLVGNYDDWYILDTTGTYNNTRLGDSRVETLRPQSDFGPNDGVPSTSGPHYKMINELQWNSSNTITLGSTSGNAEVFGMTSLTAEPTNIHAVRVLASAEKTDAGALLANTIVVSSNVAANGNSTALTTSYTHLSNIFEIDPNTGVPWGLTAINSMDCGFKIP